VATHSILGREAELAAIARFLDDVGSGSHALLLEGEAGIGKTTLWREGLRLADDKGVVLSSRASEAETRLSFTVLGDLLTPVLNRALEELPAGQRGALEAALLLGSPDATRPDARAVSLAVLGVLRSLASESPVTIAVDDVQWTDTPSARALAFAIRRLEDAPVAVVATKRTAPGLTDPLDLARLPSGVDRLTVGPIVPVALGRLLRQRLERRFGTPLVKRIHSASGGNPFFAVEIGRALGSQEPNPRPGEPLPVPVDLQELLRHRLSALSASAGHVLLIAASSARPTVDLVVGAGGERAGLEEAEDSGIVVRRAGAIEFAHPLLASTVYTGASSHARAGVHGILARIALDPEERARHFALSIDGPDEDAAAALERAAQHAEARGAPTAAAELYQLAARVTPPDSIEPLRRRRHGVAGNLWAGGDIAGARELDQRLLEELAPGPGRAHTLYLMASASWNDMARVTALLTRALQEVGDDRLTRVWILAELAWASLWACEPASSVSWADAALEVAAEFDEPAPLRTTLCVKAMAEGVLGHDATDLLERGLLLEGVLDYNELSTPRMCIGRQQTWAGALDSARETFQRELDMRLEYGYETSTWEVRAGLAELEYRAGRWQAAAQHAREAYEILVEAGWSDVLGEVLPIKAKISCARGDAGEARVVGNEALSVCERLGDRWSEIHARAALGFLELSLGNHAACHAWLAPLLERTQEMGLQEPGAFPFLPDEIEALIALGELEAATGLTDRLEEQGTKLDRALALATSARCRGLLFAAREDERAAMTAFAQAMEQHERLDEPFEFGRTLLCLGVVQRRFKQKRTARESLAASLEVFDRLGAPLWSEKARTELSRISGRAASPGELTATERRVAELVAQGSSNREVADALFVSVKTVEANLHRVYGKLGIASRRELTRALAGSALGDGVEGRPHHP
jgi:DNA-binding CsgD family transcriptional regulator